MAERRTVERLFRAFDNAYIAAHGYPPASPGGLREAYYRTGHAVARRRISSSRPAEDRPADSVLFRRHDDEYARQFGYAPARPDGVRATFYEAGYRQAFTDAGAG